MPLFKDLSLPRLVPRPVLIRSFAAAIGVVALLGSAVGGAAGVSMAPQAVASGGVFVSVAPTRLLDSRLNIGLSGPFSSHVARTFQVTGSLIPAEASRRNWQPDSDPADEPRLPVHGSCRDEQPDEFEPQLPGR